jgi:hypothetical protein
VVYRCAVCRLELTLDDKGVRLTVVPLPLDEAPLTPKSR